MTTAVTDPTTSTLAASTLGTGTSQPSVDPIQLRMKVKASAQVTVLTNEGDMVTISGKSSLRLSYGCYNSCGQLEDDTDPQGGTLRASFKQRINLSVHGDLNEEELADIQRLLATVKDIFARALSGESGDAEESGLPTDGVGELGSVSSLTASFKYSASFRAVAQVPAEAPADLATPAVSSDPGPNVSVPAGEQTPQAATPSESSYGAPVIRLKVAYRVAQQLSVYQRVADRPAPAPEALSAPTTGSAQTAIAPSASVSTTSTSQSAVAGGETTPASTTQPQPASADSRASDRAWRAAGEIVAAIAHIHVRTANLIEVITEFLGELVTSLSEQDEMDSATIYLAEEIRFRVVYDLTNSEPFESPVPSGNGAQSGEFPAGTSTPSPIAA